MYRKKSVPWTSQPGVFTGFSAPWNRGLKFAFEASLGKRDLVTNYASGPVSGVSFSGGVKGVQANFSGSQADKSCTFGVHHGMDGATEATWDVLVYFSGANPTGIICGQWDGHTQEWLLQASSGSLIWVPADNSLSARTRFDLSGAFPTAGWYRIICSWWSTSSKLLLINGVNKTASISVISTDAASIGTNNTVDELQIGMASGNSALNGAVVFARAWNVKKTLAELQDLHNVPWRIFKPLPGYFPVAAASSTPKTATANIAAAIKAPRSANASVAAAILVSNTSTASLSAAIAQRNTATASVSAVIKAGITATASVNAAIQAPRSATASLSAAVRAGQSATASLSAAVRLAAAATASLSAAVRAGQTATASISGAVQVSATATASLSASITAPGALSITASLSAAVRQANAATASIDSAIRAARTASASIDSAITAQRTASASASAAVSVAFSVSASLDSAVQRVAIASASLSAYVQADTTITQAEVDMLADIWRRLGLDIANPLVQGTTTLTFGPTITLSGSGTITSTRTGSTDSGPAAGVMLLDVWQRLGLDPANPMTASDTAINAGAVSQTVSESAGTVTVQRA